MQVSIRSLSDIQTQIRPEVVSDALCKAWEGIPDMFKGYIKSIGIHDTEDFLKKVGERLLEGSPDGLPARARDAVKASIASEAHAHGHEGMFHSVVVSMREDMQRDMERNIKKERV